jgi:hypothetical protein
MEEEAHLRRSRRLVCAAFRSSRLCYPLHMSLKPLDDKNVMLRARLYRACGDVVQYTEASYVSTHWEGGYLGVRGVDCSESTGVTNDSQVHAHAFKADEMGSRAALIRRTAS